MANKNKKTAAPAANKNNNVETPVVEVVDIKNLSDQFNKRSDTGLDANHQVDLLNGLKTYFHDDPNAKEKFGEDTVSKMDSITAIGFATVMVNEILSAKTPFAIKMRTAQLNAITEIAPMLGIQIDAKLLPAPEADNTTVVPSTAIKVSKKTEKKAKEEKKIVDEKPVTDPTKIETADQLKKALIYILSDTSAATRPYDRMVRTTEFLRSYQTIGANKLTDATEKKAKLEEIKAKSVSDLLESVRNIVGECPFSSVGLAHFVYKTAVESGNPIYPFIILYRSSINKKTGEGLKDDTIAAIVKVLVNWNVDEKIAEYTADIERKKKTVKEAKALATAIQPVQDNLDYCKKIKESICNPTFDVVNNLIDDFNSDDIKKSKPATTIVRNIIELWQPNVEFDTLANNEKKDEILDNVKKRAGVIVNAFLDPLEQNIAYKEEPVTEEKEEDSKN